MGGSDRRMKNRLKKTLTNLWSGELAAVFVFWLDYFLFKWLDHTLFKDRIFGTDIFSSVLFTLFVLSFILVQGSAYWLILTKRITDPEFGKGTVRKIYRIFRMIDLVLICLGIPVIIIFHTSVPAAVLAVFLLLFALVEWINYFEWRLSYSYNPAVVIRYTLQRKLKRSKIAKEIEQSGKVCML